MTSEGQPDESVTRRYAALRPYLDERQRRLLLGAEAAGKGFNVLLGPTVNILRVPEWGRAAETFGEDPFLFGRER